MTKGSSGNSSGSGSGSGSSGYQTTSSGTNSQVSSKCSPIFQDLTQGQGNHYCHRDYGTGASNQNSYHYSNTNGSYYYSNPNVSLIIQYTIRC